MDYFSFSLGIDVSKDFLDCCISKSIEDNIKVVSTHKFSNDKKGYSSLIAWCKKKCRSSTKVHVVLEVTGIYHENVSHFLADKTDYSMSVLLPIKAKYYFKSLNVKSKTDKIDSKYLSRYGLERKSEEWRPMSRHIRSIKQLSREFRDLKKQLNIMKNRLHARMNSYQPNPLSIKVLKQQIRLAENQCLMLEAELKELVNEDEHLSEKIDNICTIPGVGIMTVITIIGETNGFRLIENGKQLASYAGLDVRQNDSGQKTGKSKITKKGNKYIRHAMYMPALSATRYIPVLKTFYNRINEKNKCKKVGLIAVSRKLLILIYLLWKSEVPFDINYEENRKSGILKEEVSSSLIELKIRKEELEKV